MNKTTTAATEILGWHFTKTPLVLRDGTTFLFGETLKIEGEIIPCSRGLHASPTVYDALRYAPGCELYHVKLSGEVVEHGTPTDKYAASERCALTGRNAKALILLHARQCALDVAHLWKPKATTIEWLETGEKSLRADARKDAADAADDAYSGVGADAYSVVGADATAAAADADAYYDAAYYAAYAADNAAAAYDDDAYASARKKHRQMQSDRLERWALSFMETGVLPTIEVPEAKQ